MNIYEASKFNFAGRKAEVVRVGEGGEEERVWEMGRLNPVTYRRAILFVWGMKGCRRAPHKNKMYGLVSQF